MGKSSSSIKKKRSSNRSKSRTVKKSKRSKSARNKYKKHRRRHDSVSFSDDSDSRSLASVSLSDSENEYVSRRSRSRSRTRKDVKGSKKRGRKRSLSSDSSLSSPVRKSKRSKSSRRDYNRGRKRRDHPRKKPRRDVSVSSASSSESDEGDSVKRRGKSERKEKCREKSEKVEIASRNSRDRSRSSSRSRYSEYESEEEIAVEQNTARRLKSVVIVVKRESEERELEGDEHKEEIISDNDDYPSSKSNDSNDGVVRREVSQHLDHDQGENADVSDFRTSSVVSGNNGIPSSDLFGKNDDEEKRKNDASGSADSLGGEDLETILRERALENLKKFRGGSQTNVKTPAIQKCRIDATVNVSSEEENKSVQLKSTSEDAPNVVTGSQGSKHHRLSSTRNDSGLRSDGKISERSDGSDKGYDVASPGNNNASAPIPKEKVNVGISYKSINPRELSRESLTTRTNVKQGTLSKEHSQTVSMTRNKGKESAAEPAQSVEFQSDNNDNGNKIKSVHDSTMDQRSGPGSMSADVGSGNSQDATKDGSEFEQRTMTVMRGGELVQVSYTVRIPKRTPALARRLTQAVKFDR